MTKPDDVSESAWGRAGIAHREMVSEYAGFSRHRARLIISRAIDAAVRVEREACAQLVENHAVAKHHKTEPVLTERKVPSQNSILISQAIRNRGEE